MKLTTAIVKQFEADQQQHGTQAALSNLLWQAASELLMDLGVRRVRTEYHDEPGTPEYRH